MSDTVRKWETHVRKEETSGGGTCLGESVALTVEAQKSGVTSCTGNVLHDTVVPDTDCHAPIYTCRTLQCRLHLVQTVGCSE